MKPIKTNKSLQATLFICLMLLPVCAFAEVKIDNFSVSPDILNDGVASANICVETITPDIGIVKVWAAIMPPGSETDLPADPLNYSPSIDLDPGEGTCKYQKLYTGFISFGKYRVVVYAEDESGNISDPVIANVDQLFCAPPDAYEDDNTYEAATPFRVEAETQYHNFDKADDADWVKFYGIPGLTYQIQANNLEEICDVVIEIYGHDPDNISSLKLLADVDDKGKGGGESLLWDCPKNGFYYVKYSEASSRYGITTGYNIEITMPYAPDDAEIRLPTFRVLDEKTKKLISSLVFDVVSGKFTIAESPDEEGTYLPVLSEYPLSPDIAIVDFIATDYHSREKVTINIDELYKDWVLYMSPVESSGQYWYRDADSDGFGNPNDSKTGDSQPDGYVSDKTDCNDGSPAERPGQTWYKDADADSYSDGATQTSCLRPAGYRLDSELTAISGDCNDSNAAILVYTYYRDADRDGFGDPNNSTAGCTQPAGYVSDNTDCNDSDALEYPWRTWYKDGDGDGVSDGVTLNACARPAGYKLESELTAISGDCNDNNPAIQSYLYYKDLDGDGFGDPDITVTGCSQPVDYVSDNSDCNDSSAAEHPGQAWYKDADADGYSDGATQISCLRPAGYRLASELTNIGKDCDDSNAAVQQYTYCRDADRDGYGNPYDTAKACAPPEGYLPHDETCDDCNDNDADEYWGQIWYKDTDRDKYSDGNTKEICQRPAGYYTESELTATSGDCNDNDAAVQTITYYKDEDGDGFGDPDEMIFCDKSSDYVEDNTDCNDKEKKEHPGQVWYKDEDGDKYSDGAELISCERPDDFFLASELMRLSGDCNDADASIYPVNSLMSHAVVMLQVLTGQAVDAVKIDNTLTEAGADYNGLIELTDVIYILMEITLSEDSCD